MTDDHDDDERPVLLQFEDDIGAPFDEWTPTQLRNSLRVLGPAFDGVLERCHSAEFRLAWTKRKYNDARAQLARLLPKSKRLPGRRPTGNALESLLTGSPFRSPSKRGRKLGLDVSTEWLFEALRIGKEHGDRSDREALRPFVAYVLSKEGRHTAGGVVEKLVRNLQKRISEERARVRKSRSDIEKAG
jgi:hypothetical protein